MNSLDINNDDELKAEIQRLLNIDREQEVALAARVSSPGAIIASAMTLSQTTKANKASAVKTDYLQIGARILLPIILNKTVFRKSNFVVKFLVGIIAQKAAKMITQGNIKNLFIKAKSLIGIGFQQKNARPLKTLPYGN